MKKIKIKHSLLIVLTFFVAFYGKAILSNYFSFSIPTKPLKLAYYYSWWLVPTVLVTLLLFGFKNYLQNILFNKNILKALLFAAICASPMFFSSAIIGNISNELDFFSLIHRTVLAGFMEEYLFRGFLFGILFLKLRWGFIPASILGAIIFGLGHIYQGNTLPETIGVFLVTGIGAVWFAWLFVEWDNNLWIPIFIHILMNLSWTLFDVSTNALGGLYTNLFRIITIALTVILTIKYSKNKGLSIKKGNLIYNKN